MAYEGNPGTNRLANVLTNRMRRENQVPLILDFGEIQADGSLVTNTFPVPIPKGEYSVLRQLTLGATGERLTDTKEDGIHGGHTSGNGIHKHVVKIPEKMRSLLPNDRVLVAWVQSEAVVLDIVTRS